MAFHRPRLVVLFAAALLIASACAADGNSSAGTADDPAPAGADDPAAPVDTDPPTAFIAERLDGGGEFDAS